MKKVLCPLFSQDEGMKRVEDYYRVNYGNFASALYAEIRREAYGEDLGQNSWLTADELRRFAEWFRLGPGSRLLDIIILE